MAAACSTSFAGLPVADMLAAAPLAAWQAARAQAERSPLRRFRVGAVLLDPVSGRVLSRGCAHQHDGGHHMASVHAETHALSRARHADLSGTVCITFAIGPHGNPARSACPCMGCVHALQRAGVSRAVFCERDVDTWRVCDVDAANLDARPGARGLARHLRVAA